MSVGSASELSECDVQWSRCDISVESASELCEYCRVCVITARFTVGTPPPPAVCVSRQTSARPDDGLHCVDISYVASLYANVVAA